MDSITNTYIVKINGQKRSNLCVELDSMRVISITHGVTDNDINTEAKANRRKLICGCINGDSLNLAIGKPAF
ncbi:hypothetical protein [Vibrio gallaecicus]|uniref:hypothetical protein n=1 Tax=Vibrio gallaecicus TaxID=552386 RepID=UPI0025B282AC|nr:hypothetical protein [Vibrio gallaecicus]MDN3613749.1 hypothetical protein [Vibrio gallaecicus]